VIWLHNDKEIKPSKDFEYVTGADGARGLNIAEIFPEDAGVYTCEAFNDCGEAFSTCTLVVAGDFSPRKTSHVLILTHSKKKNKIQQFESI
jgi:hypothetical protein